MSITTTRKAPPAPNSLPGAPPPPAGLPGAPGTKDSHGDGGYTAASSPSAGRGRGGPPPPPMGLPSAPSAEARSAPPPPSSLPGAATPSMPSSSSGSDAQRRKSGFACAPPPPGGLPGTGRSGSKEPGFAPPEPPSSLPDALPRGKKQGTSAPRMAPPPAPDFLPAPAAVQRVDARAEEEDTCDNSWRQYLENDSEDDESCSGEDSDETPAPVSEARRISDMSILLRQTQRHSTFGRSLNMNQSAVNQSEKGNSDDEQTGEGNDTTPKSMATGGGPDNKDDGTPCSAQKQSERRSLLRRFSSSFMNKGSKTDPSEANEGCMRQWKEDISARHDDAWFQQWSESLNRDGMAVTKVATNGKPYERRLHVDPNNLTLVIRGSRSLGSTGILLDDLVDLWQGQQSSEFVKFCKRFKKDMVPPDLSKRAAVLQTPSRTYSFLFNSEALRDTLCEFVVYLLKSKNRGMMAEGPSSGTGTEQAPRDGAGKVTYSNRSTYDGQFKDYVRHGNGTLTLSDGTKYECEWKHDERSGKGSEYWTDGTIFSGSYVKGMRSGYGEMTWPEGSKYCGHFLRGRANGQGELVRTDGSVYQGTFLEDCMSGDGCMQWKDGVSYVGQFVGNRRDGFGKMTWMSGKWKCYEGYWKEGVQHGHGVLMDHNDTEFSGTFAHGRLERWDNVDDT